MFGVRKPQTKLLLASNSPRRAEILRHAGINFEVRGSNINEARRPRESPRSYVRRMALTKARVAAEHSMRKGHSAVVIGADTIVVAQGKILGKPADVREARRMLRMLSGRTHQVLTGLAVLTIPEGREKLHVETTRVRFARLAEEDIGNYLATGEPFGKAGAYGIQGIGGRYVTRIEGCYFNVMGLPLARLWAALRGFGWKDSAVC